MNIEFVGGERELPPALVERRLLPEVHHLMDAMDERGVVDPGVKEGVFENLVTKAMEDAMPGAVSVVFQPVAEIAEENGEKRRTFIWKGLGHTASQVAQSGEQFHMYNAAFRRMGIERQEARRTEDELESGTTQSFVSPKMSAQDAPRWLALQENLADEDSVRTTTAVTDQDGNILGRKLQSLLVRDIPLSAWVAMFKDSNNPWGKAFDITDENSALSIMELFDRLDLPEAVLSEGPVTIVAAVLPYIEHPLNYLSVEEQLAEFRSDQRRYQAEARATAAEWLDFDSALAFSLKKHQANLEIRSFIFGLQDSWPADMLKLLKTHELPNGHYTMSESLAAKLEEAKQKLLARGAKVVLEAPDVLMELGPAQARALKRKIEDVRLAQSFAPEGVAANQRQADVQWNLAMMNVKTGGGCSGNNPFEFVFKPRKTEAEKLLLKLMGIDFEEPTEGEEDEIGEESEALCRIELCPSRPYKTRVGGCAICLKWCQPIFEAGGDPEEEYAADAARAESAQSTAAAAAKTKNSQFAVAA